MLPAPAEAFSFAAGEVQAIFPVSISSPTQPAIESPSIKNFTSPSPKMADSVFAVPELLECVLLQLPTRNLLHAQKVCKQWRHVITTSPSIQKALFLRAGTTSDVTGAVARDLDIINITTVSVTPNPLILSSFIPGLLTLQRKVLAQDAATHGMYFSQPPAKMWTSFPMYKVHRSSSLSYNGRYRDDVEHSETIYAYASGLTFGELVASYRDKMRELEKDGWREVTDGNPRACKFVGSEVRSTRAAQ